MGPTSEAISDVVGADTVSLEVEVVKAGHLDAPNTYKYVQLDVRSTEQTRQTRTQKVPRHFPPFTYQRLCCIRTELLKPE